MTRPESNPSDLELARATAAGDAAAFEALYQRHHRKVYSLCLRMLGNAADAEDVTQEVFLQLYRKIGTFKGAAALSTWLYRLTTNAVLMRLRTNRRKHREEPAEPDELELDGRACWSRPNESAITAMDLERAIGRLPPGYRAVFLLHDVEGYDHKEVAEILGLAVGTTKSQLHKARLKLRQLLGGKRLLMSRLAKQGRPGYCTV